MVDRVITKALGGVEDLLFGEGTDAQTRNGSLYNISRIDKIHPIANFTALRTLVTTNVNLQFTKILLLGHTTDADGGEGQFYWDSASTETDNDGTIIKASDATTGRWKRLYYGEINAGWFGISSGGDVTAKLEAAFALITNNTTLVIPPGSYSVNTTSAPIGFASTNVTIYAHGVVFTQTGTAAIMFDLNTSAVILETSITNNVRWFGGWFTNNTSGNGGNTNIGIRARGITRGCIAHAYGTEHGEAFIEQEVRDAFYLYDVHGFNNDKHIWFAAYQTVTAGNPQGLTIRDCGFSIHYTAGIAVDSAISDLNIYDCYFIGKDSIVIESGSDASHGSFNNQNINILNNSFEQGTTGDYYIRVPNTNSKTLYSLKLIGNNFQELATKCIQLVSADSVSIDANRFVSNEEGFVDLGANCKDINFGSNEFFSYTSFTQGLAFACARKEITFNESPRFDDVIQLSGWNFGGISTGTGTLDMSALAGARWTGERTTKFCPPKAWLLRVRVEDSGIGSQLGIEFAKDVGETAGHRAKALLDNVTANNERTYEFWVNADDAGDLYYTATASGANTLKVQIMLVGWAR